MTKRVVMSVGEIALWRLNMVCRSRLSRFEFRHDTHQQEKKMNAQQRIKSPITCYPVTLGNDSGAKPSQTDNQVATYAQEHRDVVAHVTKLLNQAKGNEPD